MRDYLNEIFLAFISVLGGGFSGFIFGKRKNQKEVESIAIQTAEKAITVYQNALTDLEQRFEKRVSTLEKELHICKTSMELQLLEQLQQLKSKRNSKGQFTK